MNKYKFGDIFTPVSVAIKDAKESPYDKFVGLEHYDSLEPVISRYTDTSLLSSSVKEFHEGDMLVARRNVYLRRAGVALFNGLTSGDSIVLRIKSENELPKNVKRDTLSRILPFVLNSENFWIYANKHADGMNSKRISIDNLLNYEFNLPSIDEQKILAEKLWAAYEVKQSYLKMIDATDEMVKAQFIQMTGIGELNKSNNKKIPFSTFVYNMTKGPFGSDIKKSLYVPKSEDAYKVYIQANAIDKDLSLGDYYISSKYFNEKMHKFEVYPGDYIITCDGTMGKYIQMPESIEKGIISASLLRLSLNSGLLPRFFEYLWDLYILPELTKEIRNTALKHLPSATKVGEVQVPQIDITVQRAFSEIVQQADKSKAELRKSIDAIDKVIKSLINENL